MSIFRQELEKLMKNANILCTDDMLSSCEEYYKLVVQANKTTNLTRIISEKDAVQRHFFGGIELLKYFDIAQNASVIDVGTGAGFPGVPLKIARDDLDVTLLDSARKKTDFVRSATEQMGLNVKVLNMRAEDAIEQRESYDVVLSRAVANLPMLLELCVAFIKVDGYFVAWKGQMYKQELTSSLGALSTLGFTVVGQHLVGQGAILVMKKNKPTPDIYPRRFAKIKSNPL